MCLLFTEIFLRCKNSFQKAINLVLYNLSKMMSKVGKNVLNSDINKTFMECNRIHFFYMSKLQPKECFTSKFHKRISSEHKDGDNLIVLLEGIKFIIKLPFCYSKIYNYL